MVAYTEAFAIVAAGLRVAMGEPGRLMRQLVDATLNGEPRAVGRKLEGLALLRGP